MSSKTYRTITVFYSNLGLWDIELFINDFDKFMIEIPCMVNDWPFISGVPLFVFI